MSARFRWMIVLSTTVLLGGLGGSATVANDVFLRRIQLRHGLGIAGFGHEEDRIVAKAVAAARLKADTALTHAVDGVHPAVGPHPHKKAWLNSHPQEPS